VLPADDILAYLSDAPYDNSVNVRQNMGGTDTVGELAATSPVNSEPALHWLVNKVCNISACNELYGIPLLVTAVNGDLDAANFLYERMACGIQTGHHLCDIMSTCMQMDRGAILPTLMIWYSKQCPKRPLVEEAKVKWMKRALMASDLNILRRCYWTEVT
jgi:hypothetical protein